MGTIGHCRNAGWTLHCVETVENACMSDLKNWDDDTSFNLGRRWTPLDLLEASMRFSVLVQAPLILAWQRTGLSEASE